jgi:filamentous hemagglutinin family protein
MNLLHQTAKSQVKRQFLVLSKFIGLKAMNLGGMFLGWGINLYPKNLTVNCFPPLGARGKLSTVNCLIFCFFFGQNAAFGQSITPATDGTGTVVSPQGNRIDISGGKLSGDGANLFHSFQQFGLTETQTANFLSNPAIQNILARIVGGDASLINGLIRVNGGNSNLFLMNPAGIIFGANAQLNVPASFTAITANSIGFGENSFNAIGSNNYATLLGSPSSFVFSAVAPASIINRGNLAVQPGQNLTLLGGTVTNTGQLSAPLGQINISPVPGESVVRISQPGYLLSLEVSSKALNSQTENANADSDKSATTLPAMLTGGSDRVNASDVTVNSDGTVKLTNSTPQNPPANNSGENNSGTVRMSQLQTTPSQPTNPNNTTPNAGGTISQPTNPNNLTPNNGGTISQPTNPNNTIPNTGGTPSQPTNPNNLTPNTGSPTSQPTNPNNLTPNTGGATAQPTNPNNLTPNNGGATAQPTNPNNTTPNNGGATAQPTNPNNLTPNTGGATSQPTNPNNLTPNTGGATSQPTNPNNLTPNTGGATSQPTNTGSLNATNNNEDMPPQPNTGNLNSTPNNSNGGMSQQPNTGNFNTPPNNIPNNIQLPPAILVKIREQGKIIQNSLAPNIPPNSPMNGQIIPNNNFGMIPNNIQILSSPPILNYQPGQANIMQNSFLPNSQTNSSINGQIVSKSQPGVPPNNNIQILAAPGIVGDPTMPPPGNGTMPPPGPRGNIPGGKVNIPTSGANSPGNIAAISNINYLLSVEQNRADRYSAYFGDSFASQPIAAENIRDTLSKIASQTKSRSAIIYVNLFPDRLEILLFTPDGNAIRKTVAEANRTSVLTLVKEFRQEISNPRKRNTTSYKELAQKLYDRLIAPLETDLQSQGINTLLFSLDTGLRSLPLAALYDGKQFLVEKYSIAQIPTISLTDTRYQSLQNASVLAMGAAQFKQLSPLPAVPVELANIVDLWQGKSFLNEQFTLKNLRSQRNQKPYQIIHLATHSEFQAGAASDSYIQLWDTKLQLNELRQLGWNNPPVELLVLSACRTALGDEKTEMGFAGFAFQAGVKSVLASLWYVSDEGTLALMSEFYQQLKTAPIKAEALRQAQIAMIKGQVRIEQGVLRGSFTFSSNRAGNQMQITPEFASMGDRNLAHPYYWAAFTMIGSPW